jgi:phytanoyl-CoA hydroxylase
MFARDGCVATLSYTTATNMRLDNGPLHVIPGSHRFGHIHHVDTPSHLGLPADWSFDDSVCIDGDAGDSIIFHVHTIHGSPPNRSDHPRATFINRYLPTDDYQAFFATDARMRARARAEFEDGVAKGRLPVTQRGLVVHGQRKWSKGSAPWKLEPRVNH